MAHQTEVVGKYSEVAARLALIGNGWQAVSKSETDESFDFSAKDPLNGEWRTLQCKTIRRRSDRGNDLVIYAKNGRGKPYDKTDADYIVGVLVGEGEAPRVYLLDNEGKGEYWATEARAEKRWVELSIALNREVFAS